MSLIQILQLIAAIVRAFVMIYELIKKIWGDWPLY